MKKMPIIAAAAALGLALAGGAYAQNDGAGAGGNAGGNAGMGAGALPSPGGDINTNFGRVISALNNSKSMASEVGGLTTVGTVEVVALTSLDGNNQSALDNAMSRGQTDIDALHTAINGNVNLKAKLDAQGVVLDDIVAIDVAENGNVIIYTKS